MINFRFTINFYNDLANKQPKGSYASSNHSHTFASLTSKPTTLAGYGITDAAAKNDLTKIRDDLESISIGSSVDLKKYTKQSNCYTASTNGYVRIYLPDSSATAEIYGFDKIANKDFMLCDLHGDSSKSSFYSIYIKKNFSLYVNISSNVNVTFVNIQ